MDKESEEIEKQHQAVIEYIKGETLTELYWHRTLIHQLQKCHELGAKVHFSEGKPAPECFDADEEIAYKITLDLIEEEIKKKEAELKNIGGGC